VSKLFKGLLDLARNTFREAEENFVDANAISLLEVRVRDAKLNIAEAKEPLAGLMADKKAAERRAEDIQESIDQNTGYLKQAIAKKKNKLKTRLAETIAKLRNKLTAEESLIRDYSNSIDELQATINQMEEGVQEIEKEISNIKAVQAVQDAQNTLDNNFSEAEDSVTSAASMLNRIKDKQQRHTDMREAAIEMRGDSQDGDMLEELRKAGIMPENDGKVSAEDILAELEG